MARYKHDTDLMARCKQRTDLRISDLVVRYGSNLMQGINTGLTSWPVINIVKTS
jgi:hypothetical protein